MATLRSVIAVCAGARIHAFHVFAVAQSRLYVNVIEMPHLVTYVGKNGEYTSDSGMWFLEKDITGNWDVGIRFNERQYLAEKSTTTRAYFNIRGKEPPYTLYKYYGDPDEGLIITLERH